jgi:hypothetical protein
MVTPLFSQLFFVRRVSAIPSADLVRLITPFMNSSILCLRLARGNAFHPLVLFIQIVKYQVNSNPQDVRFGGMV